MLILGQIKLLRILFLDFDSQIPRVSSVYTMERGITEQIDGFATDDATLLFLAITFLGASVMAFLSLTLKDKTNR